MTLEAVTWKEQLEEWHSKPQKLLAFITKLFWDAQINPDDMVCWLAKDGKIVLNPKIDNNPAWDPEKDLREIASIRGTQRASMRGTQQ